jgi:pilus assembly protein CpaE
LATNLAFQLASQAAKVLLIDCNLQFGDAVFFAHDRKPATSLADVAREIHRLDASFLAASVVQVTPNFSILAAPDDPGQAMEVKPEHIERLLNLAAGIYDFVLVDLGRVLDPVSLKVLDRVDSIYPVLQMTLPFIRDASRLFAVFRSLGYPPGKIKLLVNRYEKGGDLSLADLEQTFGVSNVRTIPNSYQAVARAVNQGVPLAQITRGNPVTRSLDELVQALQPSVATPSNWFGRILKLA